MKKTCLTNEQLRDHAVNELVKKHPNAFHHIADEGKTLIEEFIKAKIWNFPALCEETRKVNYLKQKELDAIGNSGGWSDKKTFKFDYVIPTDLYTFMVNMVYRNFWDEDNEHIWRSFMKGIMRGDEPVGLLRKVKVYYGRVSAHAQS